MTKKPRPPEPVKWIPVSERLPKLGKAVLLGDDQASHRVYRGYWSGDRWLTCYAATGIERITHWMPMPDGPVKEDGT